MQSASPSPAMPPGTPMRLNGVDLVVYEAGAPGPRPTLVLCHGFPELAYSWRWQMEGLAARGFHVLALDQRGYGRSSAPAEVEAYDMAHLTGDLVALLDAKGIEKAVFVGHDWGGLVVWALPLRFPQRCAGIVGLNTPFLPRGAMDPISLLRKVFGEDHYIVFFQKPQAPEEIFSKDLEKTFRFFMRKSAVDPVVFGERPADRRNLAFHLALQRFSPENRDQDLLSEEELGVFVEAFAHSGFTGPINWYRNMARNWAQAADLPQHVACPCLMIMAENDIVLAPALADGMETYVPNLSRHLVRGSGHWTQQEKPEEVTQVIADWMAKTFP